MEKEKILTLLILMIFYLSVISVSLIGVSMGYKDCIEKTDSKLYCSTIGIIVEADKEILNNIQETKGAE